MRLQSIFPSSLSPEQRPLFDRIQKFTQGQDRGFTMAREDGAMLGPYNPMLHFPQYGAATWGMIEALAHNTTLPKPVHELVILVTGARFGARYEIYAHEFTAGKAGLSEAKIASLAAGVRPDELTDEEAIGFAAASALVQGKQLPESTYEAGRRTFGDQGMGELIFLVGMYCLVSVVLNGFDVPVPGRDEEGEDGRR